MWLKQSGQGVAASAPAVKTAAGNAASARALLEAYESLAVAELSELKKTTVLAVASSDEIAKVRMQRLRLSFESDRRERDVARRRC